MQIASDDLALIRAAAVDAALAAALDALDATAAAPFRAALAATKRGAGQ